MTKIEIINSALAFLGESAISSLEETTQTANTVKRLYGTTVDEVFSAAEWRFCEKREALAKSDRDGWFLLPLSLQRLVAVKRGETRYSLKSYRVEDGHIYLPNETDLQVVYRKELPENEWPAFYRSLVISCLVKNIGQALGMDGQRLRVQTYENYLVRAKKTDAHARAPRSFLGGDSYLDSWSGNRG